MIKLKELFEHDVKSVDLFSESPMRIGRWNPEILSGVGSNYTFTIGLKEKGKYIGDFGEYKIYFYPYLKETVDCFVKGDYTAAYFQYFINNDYIEINRVWQDALQIGLNRKIILEYYLKKYKGIITGDTQTDYGEKSVKKLVLQSKNMGYNIFVVINDKEKIKIDDLDDIDKYYSDGPSGLKYKIGIEKQV